MTFSLQVFPKDIVLNFLTIESNCYLEYQAGQESMMQSVEVKRGPQVPEPNNICQKQINRYFNISSWVCVSVD